jgi:predicted DNA-binding transcriptional regulator YafY
MRLSASVRETAELTWWLLGFGDQVEVVAPKRLRASLAETARSMCARYADER